MVTLDSNIATAKNKSLSIKTNWCPSTVSDPLYIQPTDFNAVVPFKYGIVYFFNQGQIINPTPVVSAPTITPVYRPLSSYAAPSRTALLFEDAVVSGSQLMTTSSNFDPCRTVLTTSTSTGYFQFQGRHNGMGNVAWYDGHVSAELPYMPTTPSDPRIRLGSPAYQICASAKVGLLAPYPSTLSWSNFSGMTPTQQDADWMIDPQ